LKNKSTVAIFVYFAIHSNIHHLGVWTDMPDTISIAISQGPSTPIWFQ